MARAKKDGTRLNIIVEQELRTRLEECSENEKRTITAIVELALSEYLDIYEKEHKIEN